MAKPKTHATHIDIDAETREQMVALLNQQLADTFDLYSQTKQAHWNVKGPDFFQLHELYDKLAGEVIEYVDLIAERATSLGGTALGTARMAVAASRLPEFPRLSIAWRPSRPWSSATPISQHHRGRPSTPRRVMAIRARRMSSLRYPEASTNRSGSSRLIFKPATRVAYRR